MKAKRIADPPKEKSPKEILEEKYLRDKSRFIGVEEIGRREKAINAEINKNDPEALERQNLWVDQWVRDHTP